uniref:Uncharacterized protein n=1 Tax=Zea mays TaxID=4577 RepID=B4FWU1_MAIZE|nr:unknown [Zea mays]
MPGWRRRRHGEGHSAGVVVRGPRHHPVVLLQARHRGCLPRQTRRRSARAPLPHRPRPPLPSRPPFPTVSGIPRHVYTFGSLSLAVQPLYNSFFLFFILID